MKRREFLKNMVAGAALAGSVPMACALDDPPASSAPETTLYLIPNTHDVVSGWLTDFQVERNTSLNNFSTPSDYANALQREIQSGETRLEEYRGGTLYSWNAFWVDIPSIKRAHREHEQLHLSFTGAGGWLDSAAHEHRQERLVGVSRRRTLREQAGLER